MTQLKLFFNHVKGVLSKSGVIGAFIGLFFFLIVFDTTILYPKNIWWLLDPKNQDGIQHFVGWEFFRFETWHFPWGSIKNYGYPQTTSIVYTDSIPLLALFFKFFASSLPVYFQYFGFWYLLCFMLQGSMACLIIKQLQPDCHVFNRLLIVVLFLLSPIMLDRMVAHHSLTAHGLILFAFYLYLRPNANYLWLVLNVIAILTHAYLAVMVFAIYVSYLVKQIWFEKSLNYSVALSFLLLNAVVVYLFAWLIGYFVLPFSSMKDVGSYPFYAMNLLAPFKATQGSMLVLGHWSKFLNYFQPPQWGQAIEGFNYLGLGIIVLVIIALILILKQRISKKSSLLFLPLALTCWILTIFAISNEIYFKDWHLLSYKPVSFLILFTHVFRASGRFFWPMYYFIMMITIAILLKRMPKKLLSIVLTGAIVLQGLDLSEKIANINLAFSISAKPDLIGNLLDSQQVAQRYHHLLFLPIVINPAFSIRGFGSYIHYAACHNMTVNLGYFARSNHDYKNFILTRKLQADALKGKLDKDTIYILLDKYRTMALINRNAKMAAIIRNDKYNLLLPS